MIEATATLEQLVRKMREAAKKTPWFSPIGGVGGNYRERAPVVGRMRGWQFGLSKVDAPKGGSAKGGWHLSAVLWPIGRGSSVDDWTFLGTAVADFGVPPERMHDADESIRQNANAVHHWHY